MLTVNETSVEPPQDDGNSLNSPRNLALEATFINHNFSQQVLKSNEPRYKFDEPNPFISEEEEGEVASVAYRYRKWDLNNGITLIARCEHDAVMQGPNNETQFLTIKALNEWDSKLANGVEWRRKLDTQRGAVLANELRNNACKLAKWTVQALLAGSDQLKFGYVSRASVRDSSKHVILETQQYKPNELTLFWPPSCAAPAVTTLGILSLKRLETSSSLTSATTPSSICSLSMRPALSRLRMMETR